MIVMTKELRKPKLMVEKAMRVPLKCCFAMKVLF